jgi:hypothetical protein
VPGGYRTARLEEIPRVENHGLRLEAAWKPVRHHLGITAFGTNAYVAGTPGEVVIEEHDEGEDYAHQELYLVLRGRATFTVDGEAVDAPAGTFVFLEDPGLTRKAVAEEAGTAVLAVGAKAGEAFVPSAWERRRTKDLPTAA